MLVEWITIITVLLIIGILLDGWRRMRNNHRGSIKMARNLPDSGDDRSDIDNYGSELPSGGARVVSVRDPDEAELYNQEVRESLDTRKSTAQSTHIPEQVALNLEESVPMLMEVEESSSDVLGDPLANPAAESFSAIEDDPLDSTRVEPSITASESINDSQPHVQEPKVHAPEPEAPDDVIVINVMARKGERFDGRILMDVLLDCDMRFGDMEIFHRHEQADGEGSVLFSMVNMIKPGSFSLSDISSFETPGVSLFLTLPMRADAMNAFSTMAATAHELQKALGAELKDENRSVMTLQTLEHCRERICEHQRKARLEQRAAV